MIYLTIRFHKLLLKVSKQIKLIMNIIINDYDVQVRNNKFNLKFSEVTGKNWSIMSRKKHK